MTYVERVAKILEGFGEQFTGGESIKAAQEWLDCRLSMAQAYAYAAVGVWDADVARQAVRAGLSPKELVEAASSIPGGVYALCNGDVAFQRLTSAVS